ncbi:glycosyltransferase family 2 protein [Geobacillus thermodenitrificans]|jgi:glycosyltransferase involved in cell wall biosynthesis|uniref:glycosyltransferase family 2 protein n=1 Tax=Geobacillus TaxID=129337 RepID=UPI0009BDA4F9|nr:MULTISPECIES: glycosyltransferase family 2 protein [Geobacillus]ARP42486.1 putative glycosyltransferase YkcC [Geobacillus thermodenitrificans]MEC5186382.1 glycosyltransferase involved in cell wall biosynthesis [Geobacillus thermodenitrificans]OQP09270.1 glycosyltransferase [Geobacillus sp. 47C-IIb]QNU31111.1 glycosyltransferase family 2 protein [Geobacillus sp. 47C-IIb]
MSDPVLAIVVPCYNEEEVLPETIGRLRSLREELIEERLISPKSALLFVDDGSRDSTWKLIYKASLRYPEVKGLKLARNAGHQNALLAGLFAAKAHADCFISIDADLQDDLSAIRAFVQKFREGYDIVYGVRRRRDTDTWFKRHTAQGFYRLMKMFGVDLVYNHADYRLMSRRAVEALEQFGEVNLFLRGIVPLIGFRSTSVYYDRKERLAGKTKYPLKKMIAFALDGVTSFSITPIRFISLIGFVSFVISLMFGAYFLFLKWAGHTETGWTSLITSIWLLGGLQLIALGLIGEYIGKIYKETKRRPRYIVDLDLWNWPLPQRLSPASTSEEPDAAELTRP